jgi:hypothetical protein
MHKLRLAVASIALSAATLAVPAVVASSASAAPVVQAAGGLVNVQVGIGDVTITDLVDVNAAVPIGVAANVCGVSVAVLAEQLGTAPVTCDIAQNQRADAALRQINLINQ